MMKETKNILRNPELQFLIQRESFIRDIEKTLSQRLERKFDRYEARLQVIEKHLKLNQHIKYETKIEEWEIVE